MGPLIFFWTAEDNLRSEIPLDIDKKCTIGPFWQFKRNTYECITTSRVVFCDLAAQKTAALPVSRGDSDNELLLTPVRIQRHHVQAPRVNIS